jgi:hypothetical protein
MKTIHLLLALLCLGTSLTAQDRGALKRVTAVFEKIESEHEGWPHLKLTMENLDGPSAEQHMWRAPDGSGLLRTERTLFDDHGPLMRRIYLENNDVLFVLERAEYEGPREGAPVQVTEKRYYFSGGELIRAIGKKGEFAAGKSVDTGKLPNKPLSGDEIEDGVYEGFQQEAQDIQDRFSGLIGGPDNTSSAYPSGDGWRLIEGTRSRDGQFALAWGIRGQSAPQAETLEDGTMAAEPEAEGLTNYIVNLKDGVILGKTAGAHHADKGYFGHSTNEVAWSSANSYVAQVCSGKWATFDANVYAMNPDGSGFSPAADLLAAAKKVAREHLAGSEAHKKFDEDAFAITLHDVSSAQRGSKTAVVVEVGGQIPKSEEEGAYFDLTVVFTLVADENGGAPTLQWSGTEAHQD